VHVQHGRCGGWCGATNVAVSSAAPSQRTATARDVANNFFRTRKSSRAAFISFSYHHRSSVLVFLSFFILPLPLSSSSFCLLYMLAVARRLFSFSIITTR